VTGLRVYRVELRSTYLLQAEKDLLQIPSHVAQGDILVAAESMAAALRLLESCGHRASRSHLTPAMGTAFDALSAAGVFEPGARVIVTTKSAHDGDGILRCLGSRSPVLIARWRRDPHDVRKVGVELQGWVEDERAARA
jgi:hypothetical protein